MAWALFCRLIVVYPEESILLIALLHLIDDFLSGKDMSLLHLSAGYSFGSTDHYRSSVTKLLDTLRPMRDDAGGVTYVVDAIAHAIQGHFGINKPGQKTGYSIGQKELAAFYPYDIAMSSALLVILERGRKIKSATSPPVRIVMQASLFDALKKLSQKIANDFTSFFRESRIFTYHPYMLVSSGHGISLLDMMGFLNGYTQMSPDEFAMHEDAVKDFFVSCKCRTEYSPSHFRPTDSKFYHVQKIRRVYQNPLPRNTETDLFV
jgi:hypothetical protein